MSELEKLIAWMEANNYDFNSLADAVQMSHDGVYQILYVRQRTSPGFRERFAYRFGHEVATAIFDPPFIPQVA